MRKTKILLEKNFKTNSAMVIVFKNTTDITRNYFIN